MAVDFSRLQSTTPDLNRVQDNLRDSFSKCQSTAGLFMLVTADPTGVPSAGAPRFVLNTKNLRLWVNAGSSWHYTALT